MKKIFWFFVVLMLLPSTVRCMTATPIQVAIWDPVQLFPERFNVYGLRLNVAYGSNQNLTGIDVGGVNVIGQNQQGIQLGLMNMSEKGWGGCVGLMNYTTDFFGLQAGLLNTVQNSVSGFQVGGLMNLSDTVNGAQIHCGILGNGAVKVTGAQFVLLGYNLTDDICGLQMAMFGFNQANALISGVQVAMLYNYAKTLNGVQFSLVNACETLSGVQIGLVNIVWQDHLSFMPLINFRF